MKLNLREAYRFLAPRLTVVVTTYGEDSNAAPFSFVMPVSIDPPLVAIASQFGHDTLKNIKENGEFVLNVPGIDMLTKVRQAGKKLPYGKSELKEFNIETEESDEVKPPRLKNCISSFECKLEWMKEAGDHMVIIGRVLKAHVRDDLYKDGILDIDKAKTVLHVSRSIFATPNKVEAE